MPAKKTLTTAGRPPIPIADLERRYCNAPAGEADQLRFPADFMFQLSNEEADALVSQNVIPSRRNFGGSPPYAFTQEGVAMLSSVLRNERAVAVNIAIMRAFVKLREVMSTHRDLAHKIEALERKYAEHDEEIQVICKAMSRNCWNCRRYRRSGRSDFSRTKARDNRLYIRPSPAKSERSTSRSRRQPVCGLASRVLNSHQ